DPERSSKCRMNKTFTFLKGFEITELPFTIHYSLFTNHYSLSFGLFIDSLFEKSIVHIGKGILILFSSKAFFNAIIARFVAERISFLFEISVQNLTTKLIELSANSWYINSTSSLPRWGNNFSMVSIVRFCTNSRSES